MTRARLAALALLAAAASACGSKSSAPPRSDFWLPASVAAFHGMTVEAPAVVAAWFAVANEGRYDLSVVNANDDTVVNAPVLLRPLAIPFPARPALLGSAPLGDGLADLLVAVAAGDSTLQLVRTWAWNAAGAVDSDPVGGQAVDLGATVLGIVALPGATPGVARLAVTLGGNRLAVVQYKRDPATGVVLKDTVVVHGLGFEPAAMAVVPANAGLGYPGDPSHVYVATLDRIVDAAHPSGAVGVAEVDLSAPAEPWPVRALLARAPTRLVAAARLRERAPASVAKDQSAFDGQPDVTRVYAVLDEGSCGTGKPIDCGIVTLDPAKTPAAGDDHIPEDWAGWMPYRAPLAVRSRPLAIAVSGPPAVAPDTTYLAPFMRLAIDDTTTFATTAVGIVAGESGLIDFYDLGRFKIASITSAPVVAGASVTSPTDASRIWLEDPASLAIGDWVPSDTAANFIQWTPGYALDQTWTVAYQGPLPGLVARVAEAWMEGSSVALAIQLGDGHPGPGATPRLSQVARLFHPALGVHVGDIVTFKAQTVPGCVGATPAGVPADQAGTVPNEFEMEITALQPPSAYAQGGYVLLGPHQHTTGLVPPEPATPPEWADCVAALTSWLAQPVVAGQVVPGTGLIVTFDAGDTNGALLTGSDVGYAGRPQFDLPFALQYRASATDPDEDALAASCPLADWDGSYPAPAGVLDCGGAGCDRAVCEQLVLARKARRRYHLAEDCTTPDPTLQQICNDRYQTSLFPLPIVNGPALAFRVGNELVTPATGIQDRERGMILRFSTTSGMNALNVSAGGPTAHATSAITYDRSAYDWGNGGYRFLVVYPGNQIADVSPNLTPIANNTIH